MLIVIVIIGILAAALIPRLSSARGRANDVARKADLAQVAAALVAYQIDHGKFPLCPDDNNKGCPLDDISDKLIAAGMSSLPKDPNTSRELTVGIDGVLTNSWQYGYIPIKKWWISKNGFVIMSATETAWWSNRVATDGGASWIETIDVNTDFNDIALCETIENNSPSENNSWSCTYVESEDVLRYIYLY